MAAARPTKLGNVQVGADAVIGDAEGVCSSSTSRHAVLSVGKTFGKIPT